MNSPRCSGIIHIFAVIHAVIVLLCGWLNVSDELVLTVATVSMIGVIAIRRGQGLGVIAASVIAGNILGFIIGTYGAELLANFIPLQALHAVTSFVTTEIIGFGLLLLFNTLGGGTLLQHSVDASNDADDTHARYFTSHTNSLYQGLW